MAAAARRFATLDDLLRSIDQGRSCEIVNGELVEKAAGDERHGMAQVQACSRIAPAYDRRRGPGDPPIGWWIRSEVDILFGNDVYRPDLSGWRRDQTPAMPSEWPVPVAPNWVCEVLSRSTAARDLGVKMRGYAASGVGHYWVIDREHELLLVYRLREGLYQVAMIAAVGERVRAEPFEAVEIDVGRLFGVESDDEPAP